MKFFNKMEQKYSKYAIHNLMNYILIFYAMGFVMFVSRNMDIYYQYLALDASMILKGQIWRLVTFMIYPPSQDIFFGLLMIYLYYSLGNTLERTWGAFRFNVYIFMGIVCHILASLLAYLIFGQVYYLDTNNLNMSLFLAFAFTFPDMQFYLLFVIPVKAKLLGIFYLIMLGVNLYLGGPADRLAIVMSLLNFILFFLMTRNLTRWRPKEIKRKRDFKNQVKIVPQRGTHHRCSICGRTEKDGESLEFRYCSKCAGNYEYCQDHLYTHQHVTAEPTEIEKKQ